MTAYDIIRKPVVTEASMAATADRKYTFVVDKRANKVEIAKAVEKIFDVKVEKVTTMNYDGKKKHRTTIEDNVFVGCNVNLVAPVTVKKGSYIAAGSTITEDVPAQALGIARARQSNKKEWAAKHKK